ncbi:MAG: tetratricopeptide repeat protein [Alphaproteobacteria bacterium]|nr:tetratricopeptide repeat protein [Alphaproteobacteria bacterium]
MSRLLRYCLPVLTGITLAACQTVPSETGNPAMDAAISKAARTAVVQKAPQTLSSLENAYKRQSDDPLAATDYAAGLRREGRLEEAAALLKPFAESEDTPSVTKSEFSAIQLSLGNHKDAERYAQKAIRQDENNYEAYQNLGVALDAQGMHDKAERAFRKGLDIWQGDPTTIMNNLALNLTSQGYLEEAAEILLKAQALAPEKIEIERNLRIVNALQQSQSGTAPKPVKKPDAS